MPRSSASAPDLTLDLEGRPDWTRPIYEAVLSEPEDRPRWIGVSGGRGSGKSFTLGEACVLAMVKWGARVVCARETLNSIADSSKQLIENRIQALGLEKYFVITEREIKYKLNNAAMIFRGLSSSSSTDMRIKSLENFALAWVDEAQSLSQASFDLLGPTIRVPGSVLMFSWNPHSPDDPVDRFFVATGGEDGILYLPGINYDRNPHFPEGLRRNLERDYRHDPGRAAHIWGGAYRVMSEAAMFTNVVVREYHTPADARFFIGIDWGYARDPTALIRCFIVGRTLYIDHEAYRVGCEIDEMPLLFDKVPGSRLWPCTADNARPEIISALKRKGFPRIRPSIKGKGSVEDGLAFLQNFDAIVIHPRCKNCVREFSLCSWKVDPRTGDVLPVPAGKHDHTVDAARYALEGARRSTYTLAHVY